MNARPRGQGSVLRAAGSHGGFETRIAIDRSWVAGGDQLGSARQVREGQGDSLWRQRAGGQWAGLEGLGGISVWVKGLMGCGAAGGGHPAWVLGEGVPSEVGVQDEE